MKVKQKHKIFEFHKETMHTLINPTFPLSKWGCNDVESITLSIDKEIHAQYYLTRSTFLLQIVVLKTYKNN